MRGAVGPTAQCPPAQVGSPGVSSDPDLQDVRRASGEPSMRRTPPPPDPGPGVVAVPQSDVCETSAVAIGSRFHIPIMACSGDRESGGARGRSVRHAGSQWNRRSLLPLHPSEHLRCPQLRVVHARKRWRLSRGPWVSCSTRRFRGDQVPARDRLGAAGVGLPLLVARGSSSPRRLRPALELPVGRAGRRRTSARGATSWWRSW
jgi:hypothetical protein